LTQELHSLSRLKNSGSVHAFPLQFRFVRRKEIQGLQVRLSETLPEFLKRELTKTVDKVSLPATLKMLLPLITSSLDNMTEQGAENIANGILDFAGQVWKLQQDAKKSQLIEAEVLPIHALSSNES